MDDAAFPGRVLTCQICTRTIARIREEAYDPTLVPTISQRHISRVHGPEAWAAVLAGKIEDAKDLAENAPHGTRRRYLAGCHCDPCTAANTEYQVEYRRKRGATPRKRRRA